MRSRCTLSAVATFRAALRIRPSNRSIPRKFLSGVRSASAQMNEPSPQPRSTCNGALRLKIFSRSSRSVSKSRDSGISGERTCLRRADPASLAGTLIRKLNRGFTAGRTKSENNLHQDLELNLASANAPSIKPKSRRAMS